MQVHVLPMALIPLRLLRVIFSIHHNQVRLPVSNET